MAMQKALLLCVIGLVFAWGTTSTVFQSNFLVSVSGVTDDGVDSFALVNNTGEFKLIRIDTNLSKIINSQI
jgi:hypothetical protein